MSWPSFIDVISGRASGFRALLSRSVLRVVSWAYASGSTVFHFAFDWQLRSVCRADVPVISVGNLTAGGTGKTPFVALLANWLGHHGCAPCLVSRGYRPTKTGENDEKLVLDLQCPGVPHVQNRDRVEACRLAVLDHSATVIVLDDGFQHRRLDRDLDIVLVDCLNPWGFDALLPRGLLRERVSNLRRADIIVLTRVDQVDEETRDSIIERVRRTISDPRIIQVRYSPSHWRNSKGETLELDRFKAPHALAFCGLGNPRAFFETLNPLDCAPICELTFADHFHYTSNALQSIGEAAVKCDADVLLTTSKDLVKIPCTELSGVPLWALEIQAEIVAGQDILEAALAEITRLV